MTEMRFLLLRENGDIKDLTPLKGLHKVEWCSFNPPSLEIETVIMLKEANPDAIYYFYYKAIILKLMRISYMIQDHHQILVKGKTWSEFYKKFSKCIRVV